MRVDAEVQSSGLLYLVGDGAVRVQAVDGEAAGIVVGDQDVSARGVDGNMDGAREERYRLAERLQRAGRIDTKGGDAMLVAAGRRSGTRADGTAVAPRNIEDWFRWMRPGVLDIGRERNRRALGESGAVEVDVVLGEFDADAGVEGHTSGFGNHRRSRKNEA